jgi:Tol biopolymer transport system component
MNRSFRLAAALLFAAPAFLGAQYFGRNKVQYESFDFSILRTEHFDVYFYPSERAAAGQAARMAERWYLRLSTLLKHQLKNRQPLILYADHPDFEQTNVISSQLGEGTGGVTESLKRRIILPLAASLAESDHVIGHELVHAFQYDITGVSPMGGGGLNRLPLWFIEGMAEYLSVGPEHPHTAMWMRDAVRRNRLPSLRQLASGEFFPYRYGQAFWAYLGGTYGDDIVGAALRAGGKSGDVSTTLAMVTGRAADSLVADWHRALRAAAAPVAAATATTLPAPKDATRAAHAPDSTPVAGARRIAGGRGDVHLFLGPALSPDGTRVVYLSEAGLFAIEMYLADAITGKPIKKLVSGTRDPHLESLQFIHSAGAWDAGGTRVAFGAVVRGRPALRIVNAASGDLEREIPFPALGEIFNPTWSPDGRAIAFSAQVGGVTDLFTYELEGGKLRQLTDDAFADLHPAWSPDGRTIAFVTDRFGTSLAQLDFGDYRLALLDVPSGAIRELPALSQGKHINPQWSPDGTSLYFLGDRGAVTNVYRVDLAGGTPAQVTNLYTGASGITALSPALSVAQRSGRAVFTHYAADGYELQAIDDPRVLAGTAPAAPPAGAATLPPAGRAAGGVPAALADARAGLPAEPGDSLRPYRPRFSLDFVAQPSVAVAADRFGTYFGGGATLFWSDMMGDRNLITMAQVYGSLDNFAGLVAYENRRHRFNWGVVAQQVPYIVGALAAYYTPINGRTAYVEDLEIVRQINREVGLFTAYPLNRSRRVELAGGVRHIGFTHELERHGVYADGSTAVDTTIEFAAPSDLTLATGGVAMVHDNSYFGATSPVLGERWRLDVSPAIGTIDFVTAVVDYRRYIMPVRPFTLAGRILHVGRYGSGAEDTRLVPLFLGYPSLVRGYEYYSFDASECGTLTTCPVYDQLLGSRIIVANAELRFPLLGALGLGEGYYGALPLEAALFYDAGLAWNDSDGARLFGTGSRRVVTSAGATLRFNLFGAAILQLDYVRPFARPDRNWMLRLSLTEGF